MPKDDMVSTLALEAERRIDSDAQSSTIFTDPTALFPPAKVARGS